MTDKEIRRLSKTELLTIIRDQERELLQERDEIGRLKTALEDKKTGLEECGSIAEASLRVNGVFEAAQAAADQYIAEINEKRAEADAKAESVLAEAGRQAADRISFAMERSGDIREQSRLEAESYWDELQGRLEEFYRTHEGFEELLEKYGAVIKITAPGVDCADDESESRAADS